MTEPIQTAPVPREFQVYVLNQYIRDSEAGKKDRNPRSCAPKKVKEYLALPDRVRRRATFPLPQMLQEARASGKPIEMAANHPPHRGAPWADYSDWASDNLFIFSRRAADVLHDLLAPAGTFIPLQCPDVELVGYMIDADEDVFDKNAAQFSWIANRPELGISTIDRYAFDTAKLGRVAIFRIPGHRAPLVLQPFVDVARSQPFHGFNFCRVWPAGQQRCWHHEEWI